MNQEALALWTRIEGYQIDDNAVNFPFSLKLAKEYSWDIKFTAEAILEYKKYAFLSCVMNYTSPSPIVDKVWHVHLLYTKQYWNIWCKEVLLKELHHNPATGDKNEKQELNNAYALTKENYKTYFGSAPPKKYWN